jgi:hypothetical protein
MVDGRPKDDEFHSPRALVVRLCIPYGEKSVSAAGQVEKLCR